MIKKIYIIVFFIVGIIAIENILELINSDASWLVVSANKVSNIGVIVRLKLLSM